MDLASDVGEWRDDWRQFDEIMKATRKSLKSDDDDPIGHAARAFRSVLKIKRLLRRLMRGCYGYDPEHRRWVSPSRQPRSAAAARECIQLGKACHLTQRILASVTAAAFYGLLTGRSATTIARDVLHMLQIAQERSPVFFAAMMDVPMLAADGAAATAGWLSANASVPSNPRLRRVLMAPPGDARGELDRHLPTAAMLAWQSWRPGDPLKPIRRISKDARVDDPHRQDLRTRQRITSRFRSGRPARATGVR